MNGAVVISWGADIPGREAAGLQVFGQAVSRFEELAKQARIQSHKEYFAVTGREGGFMILEGEVDELMRLAAEPETLALNAKAAAIVSDFTVQVFGGGTDQTVQELMGNYSGSLQELGYM
ncbi:MAG: hypothetical protein ACRDYU_14575 [Actinomycetes bacterium]